MHFVGKVDWAAAATPGPDSENASGVARLVLVGRDQGAVHTELAAGGLAPGGWVRRHVHSFEEALYVLEGKLVLEIDGHVHGLGAGDYGVVPIATWHTLANASNAPVRWLAVNSPLRLPPDAPRRDTFYAGPRPDFGLLGAAARPVGAGGPTSRYVGHYEGTPPQLEALAVADPAHGRAPAGMDTAILAYSGISVKMLLDRNAGADMLTLFTVDYETGGAAQAHDHPFEETYFFLSGEIEAELDGETYHLSPGDVMFAGVGAVHGFYNVGHERVRWLETQAPQPPARHSYRWADTWRRFEETLNR